MLYVLCKVKNKPFCRISSVMAICIPLFHSIGRIGCYLGGCCYGKETNGWMGLQYRVHGMTSLVSRYPVQLYEAAFEFSLFLILLFMFLKHDEYKGILIYVYLLCYSTFRFFIEFIRGDEVRGVWSLFSFSQYISVAIIMIIAFLLLSRRRET